MRPIKNLILLLLLPPSLASFAKTIMNLPKSESADTLSPWSKRWADNFTGWHRNDAHHFLLKYGDKIIPNFSLSDEDQHICRTGAEKHHHHQSRIFFPLCGKAVDMAFLAKHDTISEVVGVDGVRKALEEFAKENPPLNIKTDPESVVTVGAVEKMTGDKISLLRGDMLDLNDEMTGGKFDCIFDRASLVAIQPQYRAKYVEVIGNIIKPGGSILLVAFDKREGTEEARKAGPPFSVDEAEIHRLFGSLDWVESITKLDEVDEFKSDEKMAEKWKAGGLTAIFEMCILVKAKM